MCIIDHYPLGNQRTEISGGLNILVKIEELGRAEGQPVLEPRLSDIASSCTTLVLLYINPSSYDNPYISIINKSYYSIYGG